MLPPNRGSIYITCIHIHTIYTRCGPFLVPYDPIAHLNLTLFVKNHRPVRVCGTSENHTNHFTLAHYAFRVRVYPTLSLEERFYATATLPSRCYLPMQFPRRIKVIQNAIAQQQPAHSKNRRECSKTRNPRVHTKTHITEATQMGAENFLLSRMMVV